MERRATGMATQESFRFQLTLLPVIGGCGTIIQSKNKVTNQVQYGLHNNFNGT
jgi:hypothetical protein